MASEFPNTIFAYAGGFGDVKDNVADYSQPFWEATSWRAFSAQA